MSGNSKSRVSDKKQIPVSFGAYPDELERWKAAAEAEDRPLSWWIRNRLIAADARDEELAAHEAGLLKNKPQPASQPEEVHR